MGNDEKKITLTDEQKAKLDERNEKLKENIYYFNIPERFLNTDLSKSQIQCYLTHCRKSGRQEEEKKTKNKMNRVSIAALNAVNGYFKKLKPTAYQRAMLNLEEKNLVKIHKLTQEEKDSTIYKTDYKIEILKDEEEKNIPIPIKLIENKSLASLNTKQLKDIVKLYKHFNLDDWGCIDTDSLSYINKELDYKTGYYSNYGGGFNKAIYKKKAYLIADPREDPEQFNKTVIKDLEDIDITGLINKGLFSLVPLLFAVDKEDPEIKQIVGEIYKGYSNFKDDEIAQNSYIWHLPETDETYPVIIWALKPYYPLETDQYKEFEKIMNRYSKKQYSIYCNYDIATDKEKTLSMLYNEDFIYKLYDFITDEELSEQVGDKLEMLESLPNKYDLEEKLNILCTKRDEEVALIEKENELSGKRRRHATSPALKDINKEITYIQNDLDYITGLENDLIDLIPPQQFRIYYNTYQDDLYY